MTKAELSAVPVATDPESSTARYYTAVASRYGNNYGDEEGAYPANRIRWEMVSAILKGLNVNTVLEAGCGEATPLRLLQDQGFPVFGFDAVPAMVKLAREHVLDGWIRIWQGDVCDPAAYPDTYDAVLALGAIPHLTDEQQQKALANMAHATVKGGRVFVELRNELFALWTQNRYTWDLVKSLLPEKTPARAQALIAAHFNLDFPPGPDPRDTADYNNAFSRFNNPLTVPDLFAAAGLEVAAIHGYHMHAWAPQYEYVNPTRFREESLAMEWPNPEHTSWKAMLRASAMVVEAVRV